MKSTINDLDTSFVFDSNNYIIYKACHFTSVDEILQDFIYHGLEHHR